MTDGYEIRPLIEADLPRLRLWRARRHVARWWGDPAADPADEALGDPRIALWIAGQNGRPFAFLQDYDVHGWGEHPFSHLPPGARGLDLYVGEPDMIGRGHGSALLRQHVEQLFGRGVPAAGADPHPRNLPARRAFQRAGFAEVAGPVETPWGRAILMERRR